MVCVRIGFESLFLSIVVETIMFLGCSNLLITSNTVVLRTLEWSASVDNGVYPVIKKCKLGVGIKGAIKPIRSLFMYDGYLKRLNIKQFFDVQVGRHWKIP